MPGSVLKTIVGAAMGSVNTGLLQFVSLIPALIPVLINMWINSVDKNSVHNQHWKVQYDYIVVGGGTAGALIANRLAATKYRVLVLEAGGNGNFFNEVPALSHVLPQTSMDWQFVTEPQEGSCLGLTEQRSQWPSGRVLGGTSAMDDPLYVNGNPADFDRWQEMGADGWDWKSVRQHFPVPESDRKAGSDTEFEEAFESKLTVQMTDTPLARAFIQSGLKMNYSLVKVNTRANIGFSFPQFTTKKGRRQSSAKLYLSSVLKNKNLDLVNYAFVKRLVVTNGTASAVEFDRFGSTYTIKAKHEIILTAGAINTPKILMLSGIGPKEHLTALDIPVVADLPVGDNLQDQFGTHMSYTIDKSKTINAFKDMDFMQFFKYILYSEGVLAKPPVDAVAFIDTDTTPGAADPPINKAPNVQLILKPMSLTSDNGQLLRQSYGIADHYWKLFEKHTAKDSFTIVANLLRPKSRGSVRLRSGDPFAAPVIDPKYYSSREDMETMVKALKVVKNIVQQRPFRMLSVLGLGKPRECDQYLLKADKYSECLARTATLTARSPAGTCRMGDPTHPTSVVDPKLRVIGVNGLRVADASVMPALVSGSPYATTLMIAQRVTNFIVERDQEFLRRLWDQVNGFIMNGILLAAKTVAQYFGLKDFEKTLKLADSLSGHQLSEVMNASW
ncbi:unnamed protein product [Medioppia subpectinata]|uniref:Glucose-methanol-choline oxidoreductase N-terminal domain-containing protein n=1 Tax=Medioppia subpectinata TaxID=1979941 RepID=A0A7R9KKQ6_9ACAR|nr:unnamed protein product [Medioppia subpectinata]CAG2105402.1 unnamed protein product [Medioppia subpectinata]